MRGLCNAAVNFVSGLKNVLDGPKPPSFPEDGEKKYALHLKFLEVKGPQKISIGDDHLQQQNNYS